MTKLSKAAKVLLETLREFGYGPTLKKDGKRVVATEAEHHKLFPVLEGGYREMETAVFTQAWAELKAASLVAQDAEACWVQLPSLDIAPEKGAKLTFSPTTGKVSVRRPASPFPQPKEEEKMFDVKTATTAELVAKHNELKADAPVKKFADRKTAEKRVQALLDAQPKPAPKAVKVRTPRAAAGDRSDQRFIRHGVRVAGTDYKSVAAAFQELKLPMGKHIPFRAKLKASGAETFEHDGQKYNFKLVEA